MRMAIPKAIETYAGEIMTLERSLEQLKVITEAVLKDAKAEADKEIAEAKAKTKTEFQACRKASDSKAGAAHLVRRTRSKRR
jgi:hypothetical protein